jgi:hypothetical protein
MSMAEHEEVDRLKQENARLRHRLYETLGSMHVLQSKARSIERWHADPKFNVEDYAVEIQELRSNLHKEIVWDLHHDEHDWRCEGHDHKGQTTHCEVPLSVKARLQAERDDYDPGF